jgi:large subunit ribosomal protein L18
MRGTRRRSIFRRRKAGLTDYRRRLKLLTGRKPRAVVRVSNTRTTCQLVTWAATGDLVTVSMTGSDLSKKFGWPKDYSQKSVSASYLVGLAASTPGNRVFSALKGMVDAGLEIPHGENVLPDEDRINGAHINGDMAAAVESTKTKIEGAY